MHSLPTIRSLLFALVVLTVVVLGMPTTSSAQVVAFAVAFGPPPLPVYEQPFCPGEGYIWTPGYWAFDYDFDDYYWVPGTWVLAPRVGFFWTPGYWAFSGSRFVFYDGYWGPQVGFYGGINYGFGYFGDGYEGGRWEHGRFFYNRSVNNVNVTVIHNVYNTTVINRNTENRVSFNGGNGGISARPTRQQEKIARGRHVSPVAAQTEHRQAARGDREQRASVNHGRPAIAASPRPGDFKDRVPAREAGGPYTPPANRGEGGQRGNAQRQENNQPGNRQGQRPNSGQQNQDWRRNNSNNNDRPPSAVHPKDLPRRERPASVNTGNPKRDQKYQRDQDRLSQRQDQERQKLQQRQEQEHQRLDRRRADDTRRQRTEQQHQQQTQKLEQRHEQQQQKMQQRQQPPNHDQSKSRKQDRPPNQH